MAETTLRTFWCILALLFILPTVITSVLSIKTKEEKENSVTFVGFVNDHQNKFSALLEVEILASRLPPPRANDANHGKNKDNNNFGLWLASEDPESCIGKAVYGRAKVEPVHDGGLFGAKNADYQTMQLLLPLAASAPISEHQERTLYLCLRFGSEWQSLGPSSKFTLPKVTMTQVLNEEDDDDEEEEYILQDNKIIKQPAVRSRKGRALNESIPEEIEAKAMDTANVPRITNIRLRGITKDVKYADEGHIVVLEGHVVPLFIYGYGLTNETQVVFTSAQDEFGDFCDSPTDTHVKSSHIRITMLTENMAQIDIPGGDLPSVANQEQFYLCLKSEDSSHFVHQGTDTSLKIEVETLPLPIWVMIIFLCVLLCLSGLFSGLNLGLMALDQTELKIVQNTGSDKEKDYANKIFPIRKHGNFLLCSLLLGNVLVNNTLTILLDTLTSGLVAVIGATMGIVIFGEIIPQAICSRHGLAVGAYTIFLTKLFMVLTFPLSYPISKILDCLLGAEIGTVYDKKKLIELLQVTHGANDLEKDEVDIVTGALVYKEKTVRSVMTRLEDCYMLPIKTVLNFETVAEIREQGYSRIPVYDGDRTNIVHILYARDLMFIDPDDNMPLQMICEFYSNETNNVFADTPLNEMFNEFKTGEKGHMAFIQEVNDTGEGDPFYETIGLITLEDIIEEIIQQEIVDETDVVIDNRTKKKRRRENFKGGTEGTTFHQMFSEASKKIAISPQLTMAVFQYLTTSIVPFKSEYISEVVLKRLLTMDIYNEIKMKKETAGTNKRTHHHSQEDLIIIEKGKPIDYFVLIIEGKVEVNIGREELIFESGPFTYFGIQTLNQVIESPSSPLIAFKNNHTNANNTNTAGTPSSVNSADMKHLRKASTQQSIEVNPPATSNALMTKRHSAQAEMGLPSRTGSIFQAYPGFIPDYTIKALSDVLYLKIKRTTYLRAMKATLMGKKASHSGELNERELEHLLEKVNEDENMEQDINMMLRTPLGHSPNRSEGTTMDQEVTRVKIGTSGTSTPIMTVRGEPARLSMTSNRSEAMKDEFWPSEKESSNNMTTTVAFKAPIATHDSETTVSMSGASNNSNSNNTKITVEANGEAIKGKNDDSTNGLNSSGVGNNNITSESTGGGQTSTQQLDAISPQSDSGIRTSLLNKEFGR